LLRLKRESDGTIRPGAGSGEARMLAKLVELAGKLPRFEMLNDGLLIQAVAAEILDAPREQKPRRHV
jgi:hypothetical protein